MKQIRISTFILIALVAILTVQLIVYLRAPNISANPDSQTNAWNPTVPSAPSNSFLQLAYFYKPPQDGTPLAILAKNFDVFILTHRDEEKRDELQALGVSAPFHQYLLFVQIMDPGSCDERPYGNQVAFEIGDFCRISQEHPDWFLRDLAGNLIRSGNTVYMDPGNPEYRSFWLERARLLQEEKGWDGIFIDNVEASLAKIKKLGAVPEKYLEDGEYQTAVEGFLKYLRENYFAPAQRPMLANIIAYEDQKTWLRYMQYLDGAMMEDFSVDYNNRYLAVGEWEEQLQIASEAQRLGKSLVLVAQGTRDDLERQNFALASYLLVNDGLAAFRYAGSDYYEEVWLYDNYQIEPGAPLTTRHKEGENWRREFTNGYVIVNPITHKSNIVISNSQ